MDERFDEGVLQWFGHVELIVGICEEECVGRSHENEPLTKTG